LIGTGSTTAEDTNTVLPLRYTAGYSKMALVTTAQTTDATVSRVRALLEYYPAATLGTDITVEVSCDGGAHWTAAPLAAVTAYNQSSRLVAETADTPCTGGTSFAARIKTLTKRNIILTGLSLVAR
jgi:hypothetical protein